MDTKRWKVFGMVIGSKYLGEFEAETAAQAEALGMLKGKAAPVQSGEILNPVIDCAQAFEMEASAQKKAAQ